MKNKFYILMLFIGVAFTGCEPMEDIHEEIDEKISNVEGSLEYTLEEEDYTDNLGLSFTSFDSEDDARELVPGLLSDLYPALGRNSSVSVTYNIYDPISVEEYTVAAEDYEAIGLSEEYFSGLGNAVDFLEYQFPRAEQGDYVKLTYNTLADEETYMLNDADFNLISDELGDDYPAPTSSAAEYGNFERREYDDAYWSNEMILEAINIVLSENIDGVEGQKYNVSYDIYDGSAGTESMTVQYNGNSYVAVGGTAYELTSNDYDLAGAELAEEYPDPAGNAAQYHTFAIDEGSDNYWSMDMLLEAFNIVLMENYPDAEDGAKFQLTYDVYSGGVSSRTLSVVLEDESYVIDEEATVSTIEVTNVFAFTNGSWNTPLTLEEEDYAEMGQSYPNFDDEDEAIYKLAIFLESQFPYAQEGDFVAVAYDFYSGETTTEYANFIFEDSEFNYIPSVVEQTLQFSHNGSEWEPDNTIRYTLAGPDYDYIAGEFADVSGYEAAANNLAEYGNFNLNNWEDEMIFEALKVFLNNLDPSAEVGQKYILSYEVYPGYIMTQMRLIKDESGNWVLNNN